MNAEAQRAYRDRLRGGPPRQPAPHGTAAAIRRHERNRITCATCGGSGTTCACDEKWSSRPTHNIHCILKRACTDCRGTGEVSEPLCEPCRIERNRLAREYYARRR